MPKRLTEFESNLSENEQSLLLYEHCKNEHKKFMDGANKLKI